VEFVEGRETWILAVVVVVVVVKGG